MKFRFLATALTGSVAFSFNLPSHFVNSRFHPARSLPVIRSADPDVENDASEILWLPPLRKTARAKEASGDEGTYTLPMFPLGGAYTLGNEEVLNIFEPRYRKMYNDIIMSGGKQFVVPLVRNDAKGNLELAKVGVVFYLDDLKEVSEKTNDAIKYICQHSITSRVKIRRVLNPAESEKRSTYMKAEVEELKDIDGDVNTSELEARAVTALQDLTTLQASMGEAVRFTDTVAEGKTAGRGFGEGSLWGMISLWKAYLNMRTQAVSSKIQSDFQDKLTKYLLSTQKGTSKVPQSVSISDLPKELQQEVKALEKRVRSECTPMIEETTYGIQLLLQTDTHSDRLNRFTNLIELETKRLRAREALKNMFGSMDTSSS